MLVGDNKFIDREMSLLRLRVKEVLDKPHIPNLLGVRYQVKCLESALIVGGRGGNRTFMSELRGMRRQLNAELDRINDAQARQILERGEQAIADAERYYKERQPNQMRLVLSDVDRFISDLRKAKPYLQFAIERVGGLPYAEELEDFIVVKDELFSRFRALTDELERERDKQLQADVRQAEIKARRIQWIREKFAPRARELRLLFLQSIRDRRADDAQRAYDELQDENVQLGLTQVLTSLQAQRDFYAAAARDLRFLVDTEARRQMQFARHAPMKRV